MGHSDVSTTMNIYAEVNNTTTRQSLENLAKNLDTVCVGKVKNTGTKTYYYVEVKGSFKDSSGNVLD